MIQQRPKDEILRNYSVDIFKGYELHTSKPDFLGDCKHVRFFDESVESKIKDNKYYKCWFHYSDRADPADSSEFYYFVYVEEVPDEIVNIIESKLLPVIAFLESF
jgi:hypothetical protein